MDTELSVTPTVESSVEKPSVYDHSVIQRMKEVQLSKKWPFSALISDFDNSYFNTNSADKTRALAAIAERHNIPTIIVTGNDAQTLIKKIDENNLRRPEIIIGAVGTEIWVLNNDGEYVKDEKFDQKLEDIDYDRKAQATHAQTIINEWHTKGSPMEAVNFDFQHPDKEKDFIDGNAPPEQKYKLSFYFYADDEETDPNSPNQRDLVEAQIRASLPGVQISTCEEIGYNSTRTTGPKKFCVDALPIMPKAGAVNEVVQQLGIERALKVGDSGNDIVFQKEVPVGENVIVHKAKPELARQARNTTPIGDTPFGRVGPRTSRERYYVARNTNTEAGGSIIEAAIARFEVSKRFVTDEKARQEIEEIIAELKAIE
jgi:hydroxymethylpyrimidine pyrophosphatase-like HAD family hydrolase